MSSIVVENTIEIRGSEFSDKLLSYRPQDVLFFMENASCSRKSGNPHHLTDTIMEKYPYVDPFRDRVQDSGTRGNLATKETRPPCGTAQLFHPPPGWRDPTDGGRPGPIVACLITTLDHGPSQDNPQRTDANRFPGVQADTERARLQWLKEALAAADKSAPKGYTFTTSYGADISRTLLPRPAVHQIFLDFQRKTGRRMVLYSRYNNNRLLTKGFIIYK